MKKCCLCRNKVPDEAGDFCIECLDAIDTLNGLEPPKDLAKEIVDLDEESLPF